MEEIHLEMFGDDRDGAEDCQTIYNRAHKQIDTLKEHGCTISNRTVFSYDAIHYLPHTYYTLKCPSGTYEECKDECNNITKESRLEKTKSTRKRHQDAIDKHYSQVNGCPLM